MSELGRAVKHLESANALLARIRPLSVEEQVQLAVDVSVALRALRGVDAGDVTRWLDRECCAECGSSEVATLTDDGVPYCARHATALRQSQDTDAECL